MKKLIFTFIMMIFGFGLFAVPVSLQTAQKAAVNYYMHSALSKTDYTVSDSRTFQKDGLNTFYVFTFKSGGFVIVSADDAVLPILGSSDSSPFSFDNIPCNVKFWLDDYSNQIKYIVESNLSNTETKAEWTKVINNQIPDTKFVVTPLCSTTWDQSSPYNTNCPGSCPTGCVATATSQIMKKWNYPTTGVGTHSYIEATYGTLTVNYGTTTYSWSSLPASGSVSSSSSTAAKAAVATIMYHVGVAVNMTYASSGSGAYQSDIARALIDHFNYQPSAQTQYLSNFTTANWKILLNTELDAGRPVAYGGNSTASGGHSFVCDGYNSSGNYHFNWGWSGSNDGYFAIGSLNPGGIYNFNSGNTAVVRITPKSNAPIADFTCSNNTPAVGGSVDFTDLSINTPTTWAWTFEGGTPGTSTSQSPTGITYATAGKYMVTLKVTNATGSDVKILSKLINVGGAPSAWIPQNIGFTYTDRYVNEIDALSADVAWAVVKDGGTLSNYTNEFSLTTDGGTTWAPDTVTFTNSTNYAIANFHAFDATTCYAAMYPLASKGGVIAKTTNGGSSWTTSDPGFTNSWLDFVHFFDASNGVCVGDPTSSTGTSKFVIYTTSNGGTSWTTATTIPTSYSASETALTDDYDAHGDTIWFGTTQGRICRSLDKGKTWTAISTGFGSTNNPTVQVSFKDHSTGIITGTNSAGTFMGVKRSTDGGATWTTLTPTGYYVKKPIFGYRPGPTTYWINVGSGYYGKGSAYSTNDCTAMLNIDTGSVNYTAVDFFDADHGWAGSFVGINNGGIFKWNPTIIVDVNDPPVNNELISIYPNPATGYVNISGINSEAVINVYNLLGDKILSKSYDPNSGDVLRLDLSKVVGGIYLISVDTGKMLTTKRISLIK